MVSVDEVWCAVAFDVSCRLMFRAPPARMRMQRPSQRRRHSRVERLHSYPVQEVPETKIGELEAATLVGVCLLCLCGDCQAAEVPPKLKVKKEALSTAIQAAK